MVDADPERMRDVMDILIDNAVKYNTKGGKIEITTGSRDKMFTLSIANTGLQLSEGDQAHILKQSFFRSAEAKKVNHLGMGVGLLVAKTIIEAHGGRMKLEKDNIENTTFTFTLPPSDDS